MLIFLAGVALGGGPLRFVSNYLYKQTDQFLLAEGVVLSRTILWVELLKKYGTFWVLGSLHVRL